MDIVTLLVVDVADSTRLWGEYPNEMAAALEELDRMVINVVAENGGVRHVPHGESDDFVAIFARASDAVASALQLQERVTWPCTKLRIGVHSGEVRMHGEESCVGPTLNRARGLRDLANGGQTLLSAPTAELAVDCLPPDAWLMEMGTHRLRDVLRPERVSQLCHADLHNEFPPLRAASNTAARNLPVHLTNFIGRASAIDEVRQILTEHQLVTLTGAGGMGKTRMAVQIAAQMEGKFSDGVWYIDLAPITEPDVVPIAIAHTFGLRDQMGRSTMDLIINFMADRRMLVILDNCEHLLDACAQFVAFVCRSSPGVTLLTTSREPISVPGEVTWGVPSLSLDDEAVEMFVDRARLVRPGFNICHNVLPTVVEICRRLDGMPLAIELAAARMRTMSATEILGGLHDRFRLLTSGARIAFRRQQTSRASVDWSHELLSTAERVLFRRLAVFARVFDLEAAETIGESDEISRYQVLDVLSSLIEKSLVVTEDCEDRTRYRLLETVRQYAQEKLSDVGEAEAVRAHHRDHYLVLATELDGARGSDREWRINRAELEIDNLRAAFKWSCEAGDTEDALQMAASLHPLWLSRSRMREGLCWLDTALTEASSECTQVPSTVLACAMVNRAALAAWISVPGAVHLAEESLAVARTADDPALLLRALSTCVTAAAYQPEIVERYFTEATTLARAHGDDWQLSQILGAWATAAYAKGDPIAARAVADEGIRVAEAIGDRFMRRRWSWYLGWAQYAVGDDIAAAAEQFRQLANECEAAQDAYSGTVALLAQALALAHSGDTSAARIAANAAIETGAKFGGEVHGLGYAALAVAALAAGDVATADEAADRARQQLTVDGNSGRSAVRAYLMAEVALAHDDLAAARRWADHAVSATTGFHLMVALTTRARVAIAQREAGSARRYAHQALACGMEVTGHVGIPDILECLAQLAVAEGRHADAIRLLGAAHTMRQHIGVMRFKIYDGIYEETIRNLREALGRTDFDAFFAEGASLSLAGVVAFVQRGRGERNRAESGWASLTRTERDVVSLVREGLSNKEVATKLFVSPRTVQTHLTHVYAKLGLSSRLQLVQEAARQSA